MANVQKPCCVDIVNMNTHEGINNQNRCYYSFLYVQIWIMLNYLKYYILGIFVSVCFLEFSAHSSCILTKASGYPHPSGAICQPCHMSQLPCRCVGFRCANINSISGALALPKPPGESMEHNFKQWFWQVGQYVCSMTCPEEILSFPTWNNGKKSVKTMVSVNLQVKWWNDDHLTDGGFGQSTGAQGGLLPPMRQKNGWMGASFPEEKNAKTVDGRIQDDPSFFKSTCR